VKQQSWIMGLSAAVIGAMAATTAVASHDAASKNIELMIPGIWVDPDGCQHWVMDDGVEGYMTPNVMPNGRPVCGAKNTCGIVSSDHLFATNEFNVSSAGRKAFLDFFKSSGAAAFIIEGHTDSKAGAASNVNLSRKRAQSVAAIAIAAGYTVDGILAAGEAQPKATNKTSAGRASNRRVEIQCVN
jgi:outer membrane protein OmpA-like peptidoglycan-associated protein